jgi:hypothetical protein
MGYDSTLQTGAREELKKSFIDVTTDTKINTKHVRVTSLNVGSVLVDMFITKEGDDT